MNEAFERNAVTQSDIDKFWSMLHNCFDLEPREYFETEARKNGFDSPLAMACFYMWKRDKKPDPWQPIEVEPTQKFLILSGRYDPEQVKEGDPEMWRDVGVYLGTDETGRRFVNKYGAGVTPTHWLPLPDAPEGKTLVRITITKEPGEDANAEQ